MSVAAMTSPPKQLFGPLDPIVETRPDGVIVVRTAQPLPQYPDSWIDRLEYWATVAPHRIFLAERVADGAWRELTYRDAYEKALRIGSALLARGLSAETPFLILSGNNIEHALLSLAGMMVGAPSCPISTAYSLISQDLGKLKYALDLMTPRLVFASDARAYARALELARSRGIEIAAADATAAEFAATPYSALAETPISAQARAARAAITPDGIAKFLLTSGSTGHPKAVINTHRMLSSNQVMYAEALPFVKEEPPEIVDWAPWAHTFGSNSSLGLILHNGGSFYIDEGKPTPQGIGATVANLREIAPTIYFNVPKGFEALLPHLQADVELRRRFFSRLNMLFYAGAGLSRPTWDGYRELAIAELGHPIPFTTSLGSTETAPSALINVRPDADRPGIVGVPHRGVELKPANGRRDCAAPTSCRAIGADPTSPPPLSTKRGSTRSATRCASPSREISLPGSNSTAASARISSSRREPGSASARCGWISLPNSTRGSGMSRSPAMIATTWACWSSPTRPKPGAWRRI
jgi:feruloyl-CoA synthase